jgi:hypothetical protein
VPTILTPAPGTVIVGPTLPYAATWQFAAGETSVTRVEFYVSAVAAGAFETFYFASNSAATGCTVTGLTLDRAYYVTLWVQSVLGWTSSSAIVGFGTATVMAPEPTPPGDRATYQAQDYAAVLDIMRGINPATVQAVAGAGWIGIYDANEIIDPAPPVSNDRVNPTIFGRWTLEMTAPASATLDEDSPPYREGVVRVALLYETGSGRGPALQALTVIRQAMIDASSATSRAYLVEASSSRMLPPRAGWQVEELQVPFRGV